MYKDPNLDSTLKTQIIVDCVMCIQIRPFKMRNLLGGLCDLKVKNMQKKKVKGSPISGSGSLT